MPRDLPFPLGQEHREARLGRSVAFDSLPYKPVAAGVAEAPITTTDVSKMSARVVRLDPGATLEATVPEGSDGYVFMLTGNGRIAVDGSEKAIERELRGGEREQQVLARQCVWRSG
jgi:hypothetical protein